MPIASRACRNLPSPACGGGPGWGRIANLAVSAGSQLPSPTLPRKRGREQAVPASRTWTRSGVRRDRRLPVVSGARAVRAERYGRAIDAVAAERHALDHRVDLEPGRQPEPVDRLAGEPGGDALAPAVEIEVDLVFPRRRSISSPCRAARSARSSRAAPRWRSSRRAPAPAPAPACRSEDRPAGPAGLRPAIAAW